MSTQLTAEETALAVKDLVRVYPVRVNNDRDEPVNGQGLCLVSKILFKEPRKTSSGATVHGFMKVRMTCAGDETDTSVAQKKAADIVRFQDSKNPILITTVGGWFPITDDDRAILEKTDVKMDANNENEKQLRDEAAKERIRKDRAVARELQERARELETEVDEGRDIDSNPESLDFYTKTRVTEYYLWDMVQSQKAKLAEIEGKLESTREVLYNISMTHPDYTDRWLDRYNSVRNERGASDYVPNSDQLRESEEWNARRALREN
jgi:hypothetical protein